MSSPTKNDIYFYTQIKKRVSLNPRYLDENFPAYIEKIVKNNVEGKCIKEGYVVPNTVIILKRSIGNMNNNQFNGNITFDITIGAKVCNIPVNSVIKASVKKINKLGILAELGPLMIIVPKEIHQDKEPFSKINIGDEIDLLVIGKTFHLNSNVISIYAKLNSEVRKKVVIQVRKGADKHKNMDALVASETVLESESDVDDEAETESEGESGSSSENDEEEELEELDDDLGELDEDMEGEANPAEDAEIISDDDEEEDEDEDEEDDEEDDGDYEDDD
jgi:DNA-directed RNA polymerase subunit E'/Rpb7